MEGLPTTYHLHAGPPLKTDHARLILGLFTRGADDAVMFGFFQDVLLAGDKGVKLFT
jgi:hypothetical protein